MAATKMGVSVLLLLVLAALAPMGGQSVHLRAARASAQTGVKLHAKEEPAAEEGEAPAAEEGGEEHGDGEAPAEETHEEADEEAPLEDIPVGTCQAVDFQAPELEELEECVCQEGEFWNWRSRKCSKQGALGYECGFFPKDLHELVCSAGLTCKTVPNTDADHYVSHGRFRGQDLGTHPAVCAKCGPEDECKSGPPPCVRKVSFDKDDWLCVTARFAKLVPDVPEEHEETHEEAPAEEAHDEEAAPAEGEEAVEPAEGEEAPAEEGANATALIMTGRKHVRHTRHHQKKVAKAKATKTKEAPEEHAAEHVDEHHEPPMKLAYSWGHTCVTVYKAKQWLGTNRIRHLDLKAAQEILDHAEKKLEAQACKIAEAAEVSEHPPGSEEEEHHEEAAAPAEGEEAAAEGEEAPAEEAPAEE